MIDAALQSLSWYVILAILGACGLMPAALLCDRLHTRGVLYARPLALALTALAVWFVAWLGWFGYGTSLIVLAVLVLGAWSASTVRRRPDLLRAVIERRALILAGEVLYFVVFALVLLVRAQAPDAVATEKPMDLMMIRAVHAASQMPPNDPWLSGYRLSYYHLGPLSADVVGRLSGNTPEQAFNLATATAGALAALAIAGLAVDVVTLGRSATRGAMVVAAGTAVVALLLVTPLVGTVNLAAANGLGDRDWWIALGVQDVPSQLGALDGVPTTFWWWWTSTRVLPGTISEFPAFTLILGDPHAHLLALPIDLVAVALALAAFEGGVPLTWRRWVREPERLLLTGAVFAAIFMTNAWDVFVYGGLWGTAAILAFLRTGWSWLPAIIGGARWAMAPVGVALLLAVGFLESLDTPPLGVGPVIGEHSDPERWLLVWLPLLLPLCAALALLRPRLERAAAVRVLSVVLAPVGAWAVLLFNAGATNEFLARGSGWFVLGGLVLAVTLVAGCAATADRGLDRPLATALALFAAALAVLLSTELFRLVDAFPGRFNTVFKFWFNAWILLALATGGLAGLAWERGRLPAHSSARQAVRLGVPLGLLVSAATMLYVPAMAISRAREGQLSGVDAARHLQRNDPGLYATIEWSRNHLDPRQDVMVQAISESYSVGNMLATVSGVPTLLAWPNHERQWRRSVPERERRTAVDAIYAGGASTASAEVAHRFGVTYVYIGREERAAYGAEVTSRFAGWPTVVNEHGALLVQVPPVKVP